MAHWTERTFVDDTDLSGDDQHSRIEVFRPPFDDFHPYVKRYLEEL